jgi:ABC-type branched-subunit amino acid transport system substrate-binding protein
VRHRRKTAVAVVALFAAVGAVLAGTARPAPSTVGARPCSFQLRIGDVLPFTGDLAAYGANLDRGVKLAVDLQN